MNAKKVLSDTNNLEQYYNEKVIDCVSEKRQISNSIKIDI